MEDQWTQWVDSQPPAQMQELANALIKRQLASPYAPLAEGITLLRPSVDSFITKKVPPFVDVHELTPLYNAVAYKYNLLLKGPKGDGKSLSLVHFAAQTVTPHIAFNCSEDTKEKHFLGSFAIRPGKVVGSIESPWVLGAVALAIDIANEYGRAILTFEEINALTPQVQKLLNSVTDFRKNVYVAQLSRYFSLREGAFLWCTATMNPSVYGGTYDLNEDTRSRWIEVQLDYPNAEQELQIINANVPFDPAKMGIHPNRPAIQEQEWNSLVAQCVKLAGETRTGDFTYALSSRDIVALVGLIQDVGLKSALQLMVFKFEGSDRELAIARVTSNFQKMYPKESWGI